MAKAELHFLGLTTELSYIDTVYRKDLDKYKGIPVFYNQGGLIYVEFPYGREHERFLERMTTVNYELYKRGYPIDDGKILFYDANDDVYKKWTFKDAAIVDYKITFDPNGKGLTAKMAISPAIQDYGCKIHRWWHVTPIEDETYQSPVQPIEEEKKKECRLEFDIADKDKWHNGEFGFHEITPERKLADKSQWGTLKTIHKTLQNNIAKKEYIPHWLSIRKGQTIKLKLNWSGDSSQYATIAFDNNPDFSFNQPNLKSQNEVEITCNNDAGTNTNGVQLLVKGDGKDIVGAINIFYPKPKTVDIRWVFVEIFGNDTSELEFGTPQINSVKIKDIIKDALNPALIDVNILNTVADIVDIQNYKERLLKSNYIEKTAQELNTSGVKYYAVYLPTGATPMVRNRNIMSIFNLAETIDTANNLSPTDVDIYFVNLANLPSAKNIKDITGFKYNAGLSPTGLGKAYLPLNQNGGIRDENIAHETMHGIGLEHTFKTGQPVVYKQGSTNNYMDYREHKGEKYFTEKWQWEELHNSPYTR